ncbi:MAG: bifunctional (p)ppGpp synthetase/guanosine-3',5'-bis(diphosphate) 3'-pyrophosphohydrolase, partial [Deltaproteobacteria bacterium]
ITLLVAGLTKISKIEFRSKEEHQAENFRKMLLAISSDIRILLVRLADRVHNMKTLEYHKKEEKRQEIAKETLELYAPLASRLGIYWIKMQLEDCAFRYLYPSAYEELLLKINQKSAEREAFTLAVSELITREMEIHGLTVQVKGRAKHLFSIFNKMEKQRVSFDEVYDLMAFRVILNDNEIRKCYEALSIIHEKWKPVPGRIKDYIAMPKANNYRSLHTTVIGPRGERIEVQIRTREMHEWAEEGIAAHWRYKEKITGEVGDEEHIKKIRELLEAQQDINNPREYMSNLKIALYADEVYVFTPRGDVKPFPKGATPIDFAYSVHSNIGDQCVGARVNGKIVPLKYQLQNGDSIEILTQVGHQPSRDWMKHVVTARARARINAWIKIEDKGRSVEIGKGLLEKELQKSHLQLSSLLKSEEMKAILAQHSLLAIEDMYIMISKNLISPKHIINRFTHQDDCISEKKSPKTRVAKKTSAGVSVNGINDIAVKFAKCCDPIPGDKIYGFISRGRGIIAHAHNCPYVKNIDSERLMELDWTIKEKEFYPVQMRVVCRDRKGVLADLSTAISTQDANITHAEVKTDTQELEAICSFKIDVHDLEHYNRVVSAVRKLGCVVSIERLKGK